MNSSKLRPGTPRRHFWRAMAALTLAGIALLAGGCASYSAANKVELFLGAAPLPTLVPHGQALAQAERMAAMHEGDFALQGLGRSMEPVYLAGTAVVVHPTAMHMLHRGMAVVYTNSRGTSVAHMLVEKVAGGWLAIGLNNAEPDDAVVNESNLVGIIKHAYAAEDAPFRADIAAQLALQTALQRGAPMALLH